MWSAAAGVGIDSHAREADGPRARRRVMAAVACRARGPQLARRSLEGRVNRVAIHLTDLNHQVYRRIDRGTYRYESAGERFVTDLQVNTAGFVTRYPDFWGAEVERSSVGHRRRRERCEHCLQRISIYRFEKVMVKTHFARA